MSDCRFWAIMMTGAVNAAWNESTRLSRMNNEYPMADPADDVEHEPKEQQAGLDSYEAPEPQALAMLWKTPCRTFGRQDGGSCRRKVKFWASALGACVLVQLDYYAIPVSEILNTQTRPDRIIAGRSSQPNERLTFRVRPQHVQRSCIRILASLSLKAWPVRWTNAVAMGLMVQLDPINRRRRRRSSCRVPTLPNAHSRSSLAAGGRRSFLSDGRSASFVGDRVDLRAGRDRLWRQS